jgi:hypothetical protein
MAKQSKEFPMKRVLTLFPVLAVLCLLFFSVSFPRITYAAAGDKNFVARTAEENPKETTEALVKFL